VRADEAAFAHGECAKLQSEQNVRQISAWLDKMQHFDQPVARARVVFGRERDDGLAGGNVP
jgi:hypothetical protein